MNNLYILFNEVYKILFLLIPVLVTVAMIFSPLIEEYGLLSKKDEARMLLDLLVFYYSLADALKYIFKEIIPPLNLIK